MIPKNISCFHYRDVLKNIVSMLHFNCSSAGFSHHETREWLTKDPFQRTRAILYRFKKSIPLFTAPDTVTILLCHSLSLFWFHKDQIIAAACSIFSSSNIANKLKNHCSKLIMPTCNCEWILKKDMFSRFPYLFTNNTYIKNFYSLFN